MLLYLICRRDKLLKKLNVPLIEKNQKRQNQASASAIGVTLPMKFHPEVKTAYNNTKFANFDSCEAFCKENLLG